MRSCAGTSSMRTIDLPGEILAEDLQESEKRPGRILEKGGTQTPGPVRSSLLTLRPGYHITSLAFSPGTRNNYTQFLL